METTTNATATGKLVWFDFKIRDEAKALPFFKSVLAWDYEPMGPNYWMIKCDGQTIGGLEKVAGTFLATQGYVPYFAVPSVTEAIGLIKKAGGKIVGDTVAIGEGKNGYSQCFTDLDGNTLSLWSMKK